MAQFNAQVSVDLSAVQAQWTAAKQAIAALRSAVDAVASSLASITVAGAAGPGGTVTFTVSANQTNAALAALRDDAAAALAAVEATQAALSNPPVTVTVA